MFKINHPYFKVYYNTDPPIRDIRKPPEGYIWQHHEDGKTMMLVDEDLHRELDKLVVNQKLIGEISKDIGVRAWQK
ncbi:HNH endonuclease [Peribacillus butanolivorans]|uniref:HNH endonuclease n=1 Tax=Peribacillus butanolivorans TaxID=421767 RepID=UPI00366B0A97